MNAQEDESVDRLNETMDLIRGKYGDSSIHRADADDLKVTAQSTGNIAIDKVFGIGGIPQARITEIYGDNSTGKTSLALGIIAQAQSEGKYGAMIDVEHALDPDLAASIGVDLEAMVVTKPQNAEEALDQLIDLVRSNSLAVVVLDSVAALVTRDQREENLDPEAASMAVAKLLSDRLRVVVADLNQTETAVMFLNQNRLKKKAFGRTDEGGPGGKAKDSYCSIRGKLTRLKDLQDAKGNVIGARIKLKAVKNKLAPPFAQAEVDLIHGKGFPDEHAIFDMAVERGIITKKGSWYSMVYHSDPHSDQPGFWPGTPVPDTALIEEKLGQGRVPAIKRLGELTDMYPALRSVLATATT